MKTRRFISVLMALLLIMGLFAGTALAATKLAITTQPKSVTVASGKTAKVTIKATGDGLTYKWYYKEKGASSFKATSTFTGTTYSVTMNESRAGRQVYCKVTDKYGNSVKTKTATLGMQAALKITAQPKSVTVASGATAKVTLKAGGDGLTYKWYYKDKGSSRFKSTSTFTGTSYSVAMTSARAGRQVYCKVTDKYGNSVKTNTVTLGMQTPLKITAQPKSVTVANGAAAKVTVAAQGDGLTYQWYYKDKGSSTFKLTTSFTSNSYSVTMTSARAERQVYCKVTDKYGNSVKTNTATLGMKTELKIITQPENAAVADGETAKVTVKAQGDGLTYQWYYKNRNAADFTLTTAFTGASYAVTMNDSRSGRQVYCKITDQYGNTVQSKTVKLTLQYPFFYSISNGSVTITDYFGRSLDAVIPAKIEGCPVRVIEAYTFNRQTFLKSVTIPSGVTTIEQGAFAYCYSLSSVNIPSSVTTIGYGAFTESPVTLTVTEGSYAHTWCKRNEIPFILK